MNRLTRSVWLASIWLSGIASMVAIQPVWADTGVSESSEGDRRNTQENLFTDIPQLSEIDQSPTTVEAWLTQIAQASVVEVTEVRLNSTESGIEVILVTPDGQLPIPSPAVVGNALIADIPGAVLALPEGDEFQAPNPAEGIALITVTNLPDNRVRVAITGTATPPVTEITTEGQGLIVSITPGAGATAGAEADAIQVVVTGEQDDSYLVPDVGNVLDMGMDEVKRASQTHSD